ncbi:hypothetical protein [Desulforhopalus singaporensis]|uniref:Uncharacterized protein n=1 Tax=Desulforhopalus singaporensis TaxID=91360 RepID=A0A1H0LEU2_9BACT|nr:hypothetical protein [Desulforhopalus singaporensis]SDO66520.1 hypothetical protein SAMN05660330_00772 [Desulforhopalus singaporensis]
MAEIKSTMEMVLERAARMAAEAPDVSSNDDDLEAGMRLAAEFLRDNGPSLMETLENQTAKSQMEMRKGMVRTLLRNVVLPRNEELQATGKKALKAIVELNANSAEIGSICHELQQILEQYSQHKQQMTQQFEQALIGQIQQQLMAAGQEVPDNLSAAMHPKYQEELGKVTADLNNQYNDAMDQRKDFVLQHISG